jgi:hypothetical protein
MTQRDIASLFAITRESVTRHLQNIYGEGELDKASTSTESVRVGVNGQSYRMTVYNLDAVISVGYRISSKQATMFRRWATDKLVQYAIKGFAIDDERLKSAGGNDYFSELRDRIRDIRASEANLYKELREICTLCSDYDPKSKASILFFAFTQNKLLWAVTSMTAAEIVVDRASASKPNMGLTAWKGRDITKAEVGTAKNYLADTELSSLNRFTGMLLDYFEDQAERRRVVTMAELEERLNDFLKFNQRPVLTAAGRVSSTAAEAHAKAEYEKFSEQRRLKRQAESEAALVQLAAIGKSKKGRRPKSR